MENEARTVGNGLGKERGLAVRGEAVVGEERRGGGASGGGVSGRLQLPSNQGHSENKQGPTKMKCSL